MHGRELIKNSGLWVIGSGHNVIISEDNLVSSSKKISLKEGSNVNTVNELVSSSKC